MLDNIKFKGILNTRPLENQKYYWDYEDIDHLEYVDTDIEDCYIRVYFKNQTQQRLDLNGQWYIDGIEIQGWYGTWYSIDTQVTDHSLYLLLEHEEYGAETEHLIIDHTGNFILDDVYNGFDDLDYFLETN